MVNVENVDLKKFEGKTIAHVDNVFSNYFELYFTDGTMLKFESTIKRWQSTTEIDIVEDTWIN